MNLNSKDLETITAMADCDMNVCAVARKLFISHNAVVYRLYRINQKTGLNPHRFYDLVKLLEVAKENAD